jgi:hypothetical protein
MAARGSRRPSLEKSRIRVLKLTPAARLDLVHAKGKKKFISFLRKHTIKLVPKLKSNCELSGEEVGFKKFKMN